MTARDPKPSSERELILRALSALAESAGIQGDLLDPRGLVELRRGEQVARFSAYARAAVRPSHLASIQDHIAKEKDNPSLLITTHVSAPLAERLRAQGISFLDTAGNAHIDAPAWFALVTGRSASAAGTPSALAPRPLSAATWKTAYVLLRDPSAYRLPVRELGALAGVSHGAAATALRALEERGWLRDLGRRGRPVADPEGLLRAWELGYLDRLAPRLRVTQAQIPGSPTLRAWSEAFQGSFGPDTGLLGGELAAERMGQDIIATTAILHVPRWDAALIRALRVAPAQRGPITVLRTFGPVNFDPLAPGRADPLLIWAELAFIQDERLQSARAGLLEIARRRWA